MNKFIKIYFYSAAIVEANIQSVVVKSPSRPKEDWILVITLIKPELNNESGSPRTVGYSFTYSSEKEVDMAYKYVLAQLHTDDITEETFNIMEHL